MIDTRLLGSGAFATLAMILAMAAPPASAAPQITPDMMILPDSGASPITAPVSTPAPSAALQDRGRGGRGERAGRGDGGGWNGAQIRQRGADRAGDRGGGGNWDRGSQVRSAETRGAPAAPPSGGFERRGGNGSRDGTGTFAGRPGFENRRGGGDAVAPVQRNTTDNTRFSDRRGDDRGGDWNGRRDNDRGDWRRDRQDGRRDGWRDNDRGDWQRDGWRDNDRGDWRRDGWRGDNRVGRQYAYRQGFRDGARWDRGWRDNRRFNWYGHRQANRFLFRPGPYFAPFSGHFYRPVGIGFFLDPLFFQPRFFLNDPWAYRLPPSGDRFRWVRYYDDVLLVDVFSGEVVDVIENFFW